MKKKRRPIYKFVVTIIFLLIAFSFLFPYISYNYFFYPLLSPFFPDLAPFSADVTLEINSAPFIRGIGNELFICENNAMSVFFNVNDENLNSLEVRITPAFPFFVAPIFTLSGVNKTEINLFSGMLDKSKVNQNLGYGFYQELLSASDGSAITFKQVNITIIEVNNPPNLTDIGVKTVWTAGDDSSFYHKASAVDIEDGNEGSGNLLFSLEFLNNAPRLFDISNNGTMIFNPNLTLINQGVYNLSVYNLTVCVQDRGIIEIHRNISNFCGQNGGPFIDCDNFSLTLTNENRAPIISNYNPINLGFNTTGLTALRFNITVRDPDGTTPDIYWYVGNEEKKYTTGQLFDEFSHSFPCESSGDRFIRAVVTDGLLNTTLTWNINLKHISCPTTIGSSGGGGGDSLVRCQEKWGCLEWGICQNALSSFNGGLLDKDNYNIIVNNCKNTFINEVDCGFRIRSCQDVNACNSFAFKPEELEYCAVVLNPSCNDQFKNCHSGGCEFLVDCGGPCDSCPTCTDGKRNQGEKDTDCEGPCPNACLEKPPLFKRIGVQYVLSIGFIILLIFLVIQLIRYVRVRQSLENFS